MARNVVRIQLPKKDLPIDSCAAVRRAQVAKSAKRIFGEMIIVEKEER